MWRARAGWPTAICCAADASSTSACGSTRQSIAAAARMRSWRARTHFSSACARAIASSRSTARPCETGRDIALEMEKWNAGDRVRFVVERSGDRQALEGVFEPVEVDLPPAPIFPRRKPSGRVDLVRRGNVVEASTEGVRAFTLLLSPSIFDFRRPVTVVANGRTVFEGMVEPSVATMLKWAARDNDRTMVFGAELKIELASNSNRRSGDLLEKISPISCQKRGNVGTSHHEISARTGRARDRVHRGVLRRIQAPQEGVRDRRASARTAITSF